MALLVANIGLVTVLIVLAIILALLGIVYLLRRL